MERKMEPWQRTSHRRGIRRSCVSKPCGWSARRSRRTTERFGAVTRLAARPEVDVGARPGVSTEERRRVAELQREVR